MGFAAPTLLLAGGVASVRACALLAFLCSEKLRENHRAVGPRRVLKGVRVKVHQTMRKAETGLPTATWRANCP